MALAGSCHNGAEGTLIFLPLGKDVGSVKDIGGGVKWGSPINRVRFTFITGTSHVHLTVFPSFFARSKDPIVEGISQGSLAVATMERRERLFFPCSEKMSGLSRTLGAELYAGLAKRPREVL